MKDTLRKLLSMTLAFMMLFTNIMPVSAIAEASVQAQRETVVEAPKSGFTFSPYALSTLAADKEIGVGGTAEILVGESVTLKGTEGSRDRKNSTWELPSGLQLRSGNGSATAVVKGLSEEKYIVGHRYWDFWKDSYTTETFTVIVKSPNNVASIEVTPKELTLKAGEAGRLTATVTMKEGIEKTEAATWSTSDATVATVDENGNVTAVGAGTATITATAGSLSDTATVQVSATVTLDMTQVGGTSKQITIDAKTVSELTADQGSYSWKIGENFASAGDRITGNVTLVAQELSVATDLVLNPTELNLYVKETQPVTATVVPDSAVDQTVVWTSDDPSIAKVDQNGNVTGVSAGTTKVTAGVGNISKEVTVTVTNPSSTTEVYIYIQLELDSGITPEGWKVNDSGWYTVGKIEVPSRVLNSAINFPKQHTEDPELIRPYLPSIELHDINKNVASGINLDDITRWNLHVVDSGADNYQDSGKCWHLDGYLTVRVEQSTLTIKYVYSDGSKVADDYVITVPNGTSVPAVTSPTAGRDGYAPDQAVVGPVVVTGDRTIVVTYFPNDHTVTYKWTGLPNSKLYNESGAIVAPQVPATQQYKTDETYTVDTTYTAGMTLYTHDAYGNVNGKYTFSGWDQSGSQKMPNRNVIISGTWNYEEISVSTYNVTYKVDGEQYGDVETYVPNQPVTVRDTPTQENYTFNGWTTDNTCVPTSGTFRMPNQDVVFEGTFTPNKANYTIHHYLDGTKIPVANDQTGEMNIGETLMAAKSNALKPEYANAEVNRYSEQQTITISATDDNVITVYYQIPLTITAESDERVYNGQPLTQPGFKITGLVNGDAKTDFDLNMTAESTITDVGTQKNVINTASVKYKSGNVPSYYKVKYEDGTLTVTKRNVTLTSATDSKEYDGTALRNQTVMVGGDGFAENEGATYTVTGSQTLPGASVNAFDYALNTNTKAENYTIAKAEGMLTVTDRTEKYAIKAYAPDLEAEYDGNAKTASEVTYETLTFDGKTYTVEGLTSTRTETDAGNYETVITGTAVVKDASGEIVTSQFTVDTSDKGLLKIKPKPVTVKTKSATREYNGEALTATGTVTGIVEGETYGFEVKGTQTYVGKSDNTYELTWAAEGNNYTAKASNYTVTQEIGELEVTNRTEKYQLTLVANSNTENTYDGQPKSAIGVVTDVFEVEGLTYTVSGFKTSNPTEKDAGTYPNTITGNYTVTDANGKDVTKQFTVHTTNGQLVIGKKSVTLKSATLSKEYDGTALVNGTTPLAEESGWVTGEGATYTFTGSQTLPGNTPNAFSYELNNGTKLENYNINKTEGTLTVIDRTAKYEVTLVANSSLGNV